MTGVSCLDIFHFKMCHEIVTKGHSKVSYHIFIQDGLCCCMLATYRSCGGFWTAFWAVCWQPIGFMGFVWPPLMLYVGNLQVLWGCWTSGASQKQIIQTFFLQTIFKIFKQGPLTACHWDFHKNLPQELAHDRSSSSTSGRNFHQDPNKGFHNGSIKK